MKSSIFVFTLLATSIFMAGSCTHSDRAGCRGETLVSEHKEDESHNNGRNCMDCHKSKGEGEGCFTVGGSVYDTSGINPKPGGNVLLFTGPNGTGDLVTTLQVDKVANFYTTKGIAFGNGLYPAVQSPDGKMRYMTTFITNGQCNGCHGVTNEVIKMD